MNILLISHKFYPDFGGIETVSEILAVHFSNEGMDVHVLTWTEESNNKAFSFKVIRQPGLKQLMTEFFWADVIFENNPANRLSWPSLIFKKPLVIAIHTWIARVDGKISFIDKLKLFRLKHASKVIACSNAVRERSLPSALVIGNPYNEQLFKIINTEQRQYDFLFVGRLVSDKGADIAIKAIHKLQQIHKESKFPFSLTIIGDGPEKEALMKLSEELGVHNVLFTGKLSGAELVSCINRHKYALIPSRWEEPFGVVVLEAMACGCLPIVSDGGGLPDAVGEAGLIFKRGEVDDLVFSIEKLLNDPTLERAIRSKAADHLLKHSSDIIAKKYLKVITDTVCN